MEFLGPKLFSQALGWQSYMCIVSDDSCPPSPLVNLGSDLQSPLVPSREPGLDDLGQTMGEELMEVGEQDRVDLPHLGQEWLARGSACFRLPLARRTGAARLPDGWEP